MKLAQVSGIPVPSPLSGLEFLGEGGSGHGGPRNFLNVSFGGDLISRLLLFAILGAGLYFFVRLISAGYKYLTSAGESGKIQEATKELTNSAVGFVVVLMAFFLAQILEVIFGVSVL